MAADTDKRSGGEPTEAPSDKRLKDARRDGNVAKSRDVVAVSVLLSVGGFMVIGGQWLATELITYWRMMLRAAGQSQLSPVQALILGGEVFTKVSLPLLGVGVIAVVVAHFVQFGFLFSTKATSFDLRRISAVDNLKQIFSWQTVFELVKVVVKIGVIGWVSYAAVSAYLPSLAVGVRQGAPVIAAVAVKLIGTLALRIAIAIIALSAADFGIQYLRHRSRLKMTKEELKREHKESEGDPQHKSERQRLHREILQHRMFSQVRTAQCVVINPVHLAVALRYDKTTMTAPQIVARGERLVAAKIRDLARQHGVPIVRNVPLAHALIDVELESEIPADLYRAVAEVLRLVQRASDESSSATARA